MRSRSPQSLVTLGNALRNCRPDGATPEGRPGWTILTAMSRLSGEEISPRGYDMSARQRSADEIEGLSRRVEDALRRLRAEPNVERRREMAKAGLLKVFGDFDRALMRSVAVAAEPGSSLEPVLRDHASRLSARAIEEALHLCGWQVEPREPGHRSRRAAQETSKRTAAPA